MTSLTQRRHDQTRSEIADAAVALFTERGFDAVTMADVADAAGVSRRTAYRHFQNKEDLLFDHPHRWLQHFESTLQSRGANESTRDVCRRGLIAVGELIQSTRKGVLDAYAIVAATESLRGRQARAQLDWSNRYNELITADIGVGPGAQLRIATMANTLVATTTALVQVWAIEQPGADMGSMTLDALDHIDPLWPDESRTTQ